jgi:hypothetical protein
MLLLAVLALGSAGTAAWLGTRAVKLQKELAQQGVLLNRSVARLSEREGQLSTLLDSDGALSVTHLQGDSASGGVTVYWNQRDGRTLVSAYELPRLDKNRVYALWVADSGSTELITTFIPDEAGRALLKERVDPRWRAAPFRLLVTVELPSPGAVPNVPALLATAVP